MSEQQKLHRILKFIFLLSAPITLKDLAINLECSRRTVYRYFELLESVGIRVEKENNFFALKTDIATNPLQFSPVEVEKILWFANNANQQDAVCRHVIKRLESYKKTYLNLPAFLALKDENVMTGLFYAILNKKKIKIKGRLDAFTFNQVEKIAEPYFFDAGFASIMVVIEGKHQYIKLKHIVELEILKADVQTKSPAPDNWTTDVFNSTGLIEEKVELKITKNACEILTQDYPMAVSGIKEIDRNGMFKFSTVVKDFKSVGRFVLGLPGEIQVLGSIVFQNYLKEKLSAYGIDNMFYTKEAQAF